LTKWAKFLGQGEKGGHSESPRTKNSAESVKMKERCRLVSREGLTKEGGGSLPVKETAKRITNERAQIGNILVGLYGEGKSPSGHLKQ